ncbi:SpaA isopeptide-forming pilin-related protein [Bifidobacterium felsineum]|uniref:SpaA isopeptide-forming pilin-related protein n=1 Tax=Bifidobacterium felsineum TaxID=2045440 RepID=UPI0013FE2F4B|nr:isopeptide-forming domain-containing fimbrial protein [Bifidobacterium felsineum]MBT1164779.1 isopeptide-forming domain-containing fimbrial protein [Bifidobacterium felsineum]
MAKAQDETAGSVAGAAANAADKTVTLDVPQGWYLVTDTTTDKDGKTVSGGASAIVATIVDNNTNYEFPVVNTDLTQKNPSDPNGGLILVTGQVNAKHADNNVPTKTSDKDDQGTVGYGDTVNYTISEQIADTRNYDADHPLSLYIKDVASKGLAVPASANDFTVFYDANNNGKLDGNETRLTADTDYVLYSQTGGQTKGTTTVIKVNNVAGKDGQTLVVRYTATVTEDAAFDGVTNTVSVGNDNQNWVDGTPNKLNTTEVKFQKIGVDSDVLGLNGAQFVLSTKDGVTGNGQAMNYYKWFDKVNDWETTGHWGFVTKDQATRFDSKTLTNADGNLTKGVVSFQGLPAGTYTVEEVVAPNGYSSQFLPTFEVTINKDGSATFSKDKLGLVTPSTDPNKLTTVKNVKSITQLPLTGAAGTALFVVIAALLAGAGVTVFAKSHSTKHALEA